MVYVIVAGALLGGVGLAAQDAVREIVLPGSFEPFQEIALHANVTGYVGRVRVDIGDVVQPGAELARLDMPEMEAEIKQAEAEVLAMEAELRRAKAEAGLAQIKHRRVAEVQSREPLAVTQQDVDIAGGELEVAQARLHSADARLAVAEARKAHLLALASYGTIRAPFHAVVVRRHVHPGALVVAGADGGGPLFELVSAERLRLVVPVPESAAPAVRPGLRAEIEVDALPGRSFVAEVSRTAGVLSDDTRTMRVEIDMSTEGGLLTSGMYASVRFELPAAASTPER
jgi:RND family efflux transporter MFP subunit